MARELLREQAPDICSIPDGLAGSCDPGQPQGPPVADPNAPGGAMAAPLAGATPPGGFSTNMGADGMGIDLPQPIRKSLSCSMIPFRSSFAL